MRRRCSWKLDPTSIMSINRIKQPRFSRHSRLTSCSRSLPIYSKVKRMMKKQARNRRERLSLKSSHLIGGWYSLCTDKWTRNMSHRTKLMLMPLRMLCQLELRRSIHLSKMRKRSHWCQSISSSKCKLRFSVSPNKQSSQCNSLERAVLLCSSMRMWRTTCRRCRSTTMPGSKTRRRAPNDLLLLTLTPRIFTSIIQLISTIITFL